MRGILTYPAHYCRKLGDVFAMRTHTYSLPNYCNDFLMISACSMTGKEKCLNKAIQQLQNCLHPGGNTFCTAEREKWGWYLTCTAMKKWKGNVSCFPNCTGWITACKGAFTGPQVRRDWWGGGLRGLRLGSRVAACLSFYWNNTRHKRFIPNIKSHWRIPSDGSWALHMW